MTKHKKNRKQKIIAELRRKLQTSSSPILSSVPPKNSNEPNSNLPIYTITSRKKIVISGEHRYSPSRYINPNNVLMYLKKDLTKTTVATGSILGLELFLLFLLQKQVIIIPKLNF